MALLEELKIEVLKHHLDVDVIATNAKWFPIHGVDAFVIDYKTMIGAHVV